MSNLLAYIFLRALPVPNVPYQLMIENHLNLQ